MSQAAEQEVEQQEVEVSSEDKDITSLSGEALARARGDFLDDETPSDKSESVEEEQASDHKETGKPGPIPYNRFSEVNENYKQERAARLQLEEELARLKGSVPKEEEKPKEKEPEFDTEKALNDEYQALLDGDVEKAQRIRIAAMEHQQKAFQEQARRAAREELEEAKRQDAARSEEQERLQAAKIVSEIVQRHPEFDAESAEYNVDLADVFTMWTRLYQERGMPPAEAFKAAERQAFPSKNDAGLTKEQLERNAGRMANSPPAANSGASVRSEKVDYAKASDDEIKKLSGAELAKARGDIL